MPAAPNQPNRPSDPGASAAPDQPALPEGGFATDAFQMESAAPTPDPGPAGATPLDPASGRSDFVTSAFEAGPGGSDSGSKPPAEPRFATGFFTAEELTPPKRKFPAVLVIALAAVLVLAAFAGWFLLGR